MNRAAKYLGPLGLVLTIAPPLLFLLQSISEPAMKAAMLLGSILWFVAAPWFLKGGDA